MKLTVLSCLLYAYIVVSVVTITSGLISYPIDTIRRRMMMTSGEAVKYKGSMDCAVQVIKNEGFMSLMKGAGEVAFVLPILGGGFKFFLSSNAKLF